MSVSKISNYFTPVSTKRGKPDSSPDLVNCQRDLSAVMDKEKVGDLTRGQLMADMSTMLNGILDSKLSKLATKEDIGVVSQKITVLEQENSAMKAEILRLREQESQILGKLVDLEGRSRRNNLIFRGLTWAGNNPDFRYVVREFCLKELGCDNGLWINRAHPLGRDKKLVIAHIPQDVDIEYILTRAYLVKDKGYSVFRDYPLEIRKKRAYLFAVREEVERLCGRRRMPVEFDHLRINGVRFTWEENGLKAGNQDGAEKLQELLKRDFRAFLVTLKQKGPRSVRPEEVPPSNTSQSRTGEQDTAINTTANNQSERRSAATAPVPPGGSNIPTTH